MPTEIWGTGWFSPPKELSWQPRGLIWHRLPRPAEQLCHHPQPQGNHRRFCFRICLRFGFSGNASWRARVAWAGRGGARRWCWQSAGWARASVKGWRWAKAPVRSEATGADWERKECLKKTQRSWALNQTSCAFVLLGHYFAFPFAQFSLKGKKCRELCLSKSPSSPLADRSALQTPSQLQKASADIT